jgi:hypothetical protein
LQRLVTFLSGIIIGLVILAIVGFVFATWYDGIDQVVSRTATGTAPITVLSQTKVENLNVDLIDGNDTARFPHLLACIPSYQNYSTVGTSWTTIYTCTNCSGEILGANIMIANLAATATMELNIDGNITNVTNNAALEQPYWWRARYANFLNISLKTSSGSYRAYAKIWLCQDQLQKVGSTTCLPKNISKSSTSTSWVSLYSCANCSGQLGVLWLSNSGANIRTDFNITIDGVTFIDNNYICGVSGACFYGTRVLLYSPIFRRNLTMSYRTGTGGNTATASVYWCEEVLTQA